MEDNAKKSGGSFLAGCATAILILVVLLVALYGAIYYFGFVQRGGVYDDLRSDFAQMQLNGLIPHIEMYHGQQGVYPETLEALEAFVPDGALILLDDASAHPSDARRPLFYERVGEQGYYLRSVGPDGIAFTEDDILPDAVYADRSGLILEKVD